METSSEHTTLRGRAPLAEGAGAGGGTVVLEWYSWLNEKFGTGHPGSGSIELPITGDGTAGALLARMAASSEEFERVAYDSQQGRLREYVALILNGQAVELAGGLERRLRPGDHLLLLPGISGGEMLPGRGCGVSLPPAGSLSRQRTRSSASVSMSGARVECPPSA